jgi:hypothetical protein
MPTTHLSKLLGRHIVREKEAHDLSRNPEFSSFQFLGYRTSAIGMELVALCDADGMTEGDIVRRRDEFFEVVRTLPHHYALKPRGRNPYGLLGFVFAEGCTEQTARFIARQTRISHAAGTGGVSVAWAIDVPNHRIHTHDNPVSIFPPVVIVARTVYPGLEFMESLLSKVEREAAGEQEPETPQGRNGGGTDRHAHDVFISYASEDSRIAVEIQRELERRHVRVWLDKTVLRPGDSIRQSIEAGLAGARYGLVLLSRNFFLRDGPQRELNGMFAREMSEGRNLVLPVWHEIDERDLSRHAPILADKYALKTYDGIPFIADQVMRVLGTPPSLPPPDRTEPVRKSGPQVDSGMSHILLVAANSTSRPLDLDWEIKEILADFRAAKDRDRFLPKTVLGATMGTLTQAMLDDPPTVVHFSGHGKQDGIVLRSESGGKQVVSGGALASLFGQFSPTVECVVLNLCWSEAQARAIHRHVPYVIGTNDRMPDDAALAFSRGFYKAYAARRDVPFAFGVAKAIVEGECPGDEDLLVLLRPDSPLTEHGQPELPTGF